MVLKEAISQEGQKKEIAQQKVDEMETQINEFFEAISDDTTLEEAYSEEKITKIAQTLQQYKEQIKELEEHAVPMNPPTFQAQIEKDSTTTTENIAQNIPRVA